MNKEGRLYNTSNTGDSVSSRYPNTEKRVENSAWQRGIFIELRGVCIAEETLSPVFDISSQSKQ